MDTPDEPSLFETMLAEAHAPFVFELDGATWVIDAPSADGVAALDVCQSVDDVLDELLAEDVADELLEVLDELAEDDQRYTTTTARLADDLRAHFALDAHPPGGWDHLVDHIERYGAAIEADLPETWPGVELAQWFRGQRPWAQLWRLLSQLPAGSRWSAARLLDEDAAAEQLDAEADEDEDAAAERDRDPGPPLVGETYDRQLIRTLVSIARQQLHATYAVAAPKGKGGNPPLPLERPRTARDALLDAEGLNEVFDIFAQVDQTWSDPRDVGRGDDELPPGFRSSDTGLIVPD